MGPRTLRTILGLALVAGMLALGCSESDPVQKAADIVQQEAEELGEAARTGAAADTVRDAQKAVNEFSDEVQEKGFNNVVEDAADDAVVRIKRSDAEARAAYDEARARGKDRIEAAGAAYDAVDRDNGLNNRD